VTDEIREQSEFFTSGEKDFLTKTTTGCIRGKEIRGTSMLDTYNHSNIGSGDIRYNNFFTQE